jgi:hypothetical protein
MSYEVKKVDVWAGDILNRPGTLARVLEALTSVGVQLEFMVARQVNERTSRVFLAPIKGVKQKRAASDVGLVPAAGMHAVRIEGPDRAGLGANITRVVADQGVNLRGASAATIGNKAVFYLAVQSEQDQNETVRIARKLLKKPGRR